MASQADSTSHLESPANQRAIYWEWIAERCGWCLAAAFLACAFAGIVGAGPLGQRTAASRDGHFAVEYSTPIRREAPTELRLRWRDAQNPIAIRISREIVQESSDVVFVPRPVREAVEANHVVYTFDRPPSADRGTIVIRFHPTTLGRLDYQVELAGKSAVNIEQRVLP
jgi:hypothetical protein